MPFAPAAGESESEALGLDFDGRIKLHFQGATFGRGGELAPFRELDEALSLTATAASEQRDRGAGKKTQHTLVNLFRQYVFGPLVGGEDVNDTRYRVLAADQPSRTADQDRRDDGSPCALNHLPVG